MTSSNTGLLHQHYNAVLEGPNQAVGGACGPLGFRGLNTSMILLGCGPSYTALWQQHHREGKEEAGLNHPQVRLRPELPPPQTSRCCQVLNSLLFLPQFCLRISDRPVLVRSAVRRTGRV